MCSHFQNQAYFNSLFLKEHAPTYEEAPSEAPVTSTVHVEDPLVVNVEFAPHTPMDEVFINYPNKPAPSLEGDDAAMGLDGYLGHATMNRSKGEDEIGYISGVQSQGRGKKNRRKVDVYPFPEDFRHFKYLPVRARVWYDDQIIKYVLSLNGLTESLRKKSVVDHLKTIGVFELSRPALSIVAAAAFSHP